MSTSLRIFALLLIIIYFLLIFRLLKKKKFALKYSLLWLLAGIVMLIVIIWPGILHWFAGLLGIEVASNGLFAMCILLEIIIMISITVVISDFANRIKGLIQNVALLEKRVRNIEAEFDGKSKDELKHG